MKLRVLIGLLQLTCCLSPTVATERSPDAVVKELYKEVTARNPLGIPKGVDKTAIWPFLSKRLVKRLYAAQACENDYFRHHAGEGGKPELPWLESGIFSGENEQATPAAAVVEKVDRQMDGSFHARVRLTYRNSTDTRGQVSRATSTYHWDVVAVVIAKNGRFAVDDILVFKNDSTEIQSRLEGAFPGCDGSRWVGDKR
jgi:hypothetical protein